MEETINDEIIRQADDVPWMATTAAHRPELVHSLGALPLRPVQVLPTRDPWLPVVSREVRALGLSSLVLFRRRRGELLAAVMLVIPRRRFLGAVLLMFILTGAVATHIINHDSLADSVSAPVHLVLAGVVALACWPADWREPLALGRRGPGSERSASKHS